MGIFSDTYEDNAERIGWILQSFYVQDSSPRERLPVTPPPVWHPCPACGSLFLQLNALAEHLRRICRGRHVYVRLNGEIVRDFAWAPDGLSSLEVIQLGGIESKVAIRAGGTTKTFSLKKSIQLESYVPANFDGVVEIRVSGAHDRASTFRIYVRSAPTFSRGDLETLLRELLLSSLEQGRDPDLAEWRRRAAVDPDDVLGERLVNGVFEYTLGMRLEGRGERASKEHLEAAFGQLLPFEISLATSLRSALALKMNCFDVLRQRAANSPFASASWLFNGTVRPQADLSSTGGRSIEVAADDATELILSACRYLALTDFVKLQTTLETLDQLPYALSKNDRDKIALVRARAHVSIAANAYDELRFHPQFGAEATRWLQANREDS